MYDPNTYVFLSCVTAEFETATGAFPGFRSHLRQDLPLADADTVKKLADEIRKCGVVIHLVGAEPGAVAHPKAVAEFLKAEPEFLGNHTELRAALGDCSDLTYTQWEAFLALHYGVSLRVYATDPGAVAQADHLRRLRLGRNYPGERRIAKPGDLTGQLLGDLVDIGVAPAPPADRWFWTSRSPGNDGTGLSRLALAESLLATTVFVALVVFLGWYFLLLTAVLVVPFALLRTDESDRRAKAYAQRMLARDRFVKVHLTLTDATSLAVKVDTTIEAVDAWWYAVKVLFVITVTRPCALVMSLLHNFWVSIAEIPNNWRRVCLCTDVVRPVELIPGSPEYPAYGPFAGRIRGSLHHFGTIREHWVWLTAIVFSWSSLLWISFVFNEFDYVTALIVTKAMAAGVAFVYAPFYLAYAVTLWYRWSLKSTSVVWLPLLYIATDVTAPGWTVNQRLQNAVDSRFAASMRRFGLVCSAFVVGWLVLRAVGVGVHPMLVEFSPAVDYYFGGSGAVVVASWSLASVVNTGLAFLIYWVADAEIRRRLNHRGWQDATILRWYKAVTLTRWGLFGFSWICTAWVAVQIAIHSRPIPVVLRGLPWTAPGG